ncbi:hypothetical protein COO60DRAFT_40644 [Scenedesmus sp. NREL 46B-D3]|nr:hypothetical protein COO60DRAFT_40644 [Scenedesmus sp. NREL 46B-D3]
MATSPGHMLHLIAWAQLGVLLRVYLEVLLGNGCSPSHPWIPCVTSNGSRTGGAFFVDLPINVAGCFLMGLFVSSDVLSNSLRHTLTVEAPVAILPVRSPLQTHLPFQVGLRTGLCGSLTTFASWQLQMVVMMVGGRPMPGGSQWPEAAAGLIVGCMVSLASLVAGQHLALYVYHKLNPGAFIPYGSPAPEQLALEEEHGDKAQQQQQHSSEALGRVSGEGPGGRAVLRTVSSIERGSATLVMIEADNSQLYQAAAAAAAAADVEAASSGSSRASGFKGSSGAVADSAPGPAAGPEQQQAAAPFTASQQLQQRRASGNAATRGIGSAELALMMI